MASSRAIRAARAFVEISADDKHLKRTLDEDKARLRSFAQQAALIGSIAVLSAAAAGLKAASTMEEQLNKFNVVFAENSTAVRAWADGFAADVGRSKRQIVEFLGATQDLLVPAGIDPQAAQEMSKQLTKLAVDVASFNNAADSDVLRDFHAALTGGGETVKKYGVILNVATTNAELLAQGINPKEATDAQKVYARLQILLKGTTAAQGDAVRSGGSLANQMKRLQAQLEDLAVSAGQALLPMAAQLVAMLNQTLVPISEWIGQNPILVQQITALAGAILGVITVFKAVNLAMSIYARRAVIVQALSGPAGWAALAVGVGLAGAALSSLNETLDKTDEQLTAATASAADFRTQLDDLDGTTVDIELRVNKVDASEVETALDAFALAREEISDLAGLTSEVDGELKFAGFTDSLKSLRSQIEREGGPLKDVRLKQVVDIEAQLNVAFASADGSVEKLSAYAKAAELARNAITNFGSESENVESRLTAALTTLGSLADESDRQAVAMIRAGAAAAEHASAVGADENATNLYNDALRQANEFLLSATDRADRHARSIERAEALTERFRSRQAALSKNTAEITGLMDSEQTSAERLADKLELLAQREQILERIRRGGGRDDNAFSSTELDQLRDKLIDAATGFGGEMRKVRDEIDKLNGTLSETEIKLRDLAEKGVPDDKIAELREAFAQLEQLRAARDKAEEQDRQQKQQQEEQQQLTEQKRDRADEIRDLFKTPAERFAELVDEVRGLVLDPSIGLDRETATKYLEQQRDRLFNDVNASKADRERKDEQFRKQNSQDLRTAAGQSLLANLMNRTESVEQQQAKTLDRIEQLQARHVELTERGPKTAPV